MEYRKAGSGDIESLVTLRKKQLIDEGGKETVSIDEELERFFREGLADGSVVVWVAEDEGEIVSTVGVCFYNYPPTFRNATGKIAYLTNVYTKDEYRNRGIATDLLKHIMDEIKAEKCGITRLHASSQGRKMYEKMGFTDDEGFMSLKNE